MAIHTYNHLSLWFRPLYFFLVSKVVIVLILRWEFKKKDFEKKRKKTRFRPEKKVRFKKKVRKHYFNQGKKETKILTKIKGLDQEKKQVLRSSLFYLKIPTSVLYSVLSYVGSSDLARQRSAVHNQNKNIVSLQNHNEQRFQDETFQTWCYMRTKQW